MNTIVTTLKRVARVATVGAFALTLVPATAGAKETMPLDAPSALLMPADVATLGYDDYGAYMGSLYSLEQVFQMAGVIDEVDPETLEEMGILSFSSLDLDPITEDGEQADSWTSFFSMITAFTGDDLAEEDFASVRAGYEEDGTDIIEEDAGIGNDSFMYTEVEESEKGGAETTITVSFQLASVEVDVSVIGNNEAVDPDLALEAAAIVEKKLESLIESGEIDGSPAPGLSLATPRYAAETLNPGRAEYDIVNGEAVINPSDPDATAIVQDRVDEYGIDSQFSTAVEYKIEETIKDYDPRLHFQVTSFDSARDAARYVNERYDDLSQTEDLENLDEIRVPSRAYEDGEATALTYETTSGGDTYENIRLFIQDGHFVYDVTLTGFEAADLDVLVAMIDDMLDCGQNSCVETLDPPAELMDYFEAQAEIWTSESGS